MSDKPFLTYDQLIDKLVLEKQLCVPDRHDAIEKLKKHSYFALITGYKLPFKTKAGTYRLHTTFDDIYALFLFDDALRGLFLRFILQIENHVKSLMSYSFCSRYGENQQEYLNATNYNYIPENQTKINDLIGRLSKLATGDTEYPYINHQYRAHNNVPLWVMTKALTLGTVSKMYSFFPQSLQSCISREFPEVTESDLVGMLNMLSRIRNVCAHNERLFDYRFQKGTIHDTDIHQRLGIPKNRGNQYKKGKKDLFATIIIFYYLLDPGEFEQFIDELSRLIDDLLNKTKMLDRNQMLKYLGFPANWKNVAHA